MADRRLLGAMAGLMRGADNAATNIHNIMQASYKLKQDRELLDLKKKEIQSNLDLAPYEKEAATERIKMYRTTNETNLQKAKMAGEEHQVNLDKIKAGIKFMQNFQQKQGATPAESGTMDTSQLGWSYNTGTGNLTVGNRGKPDDFFKSDFSSAAEAVGKIRGLSIPDEDKATRIKTVQDRLRRAYPTESTKIEDYFMAEE